MKVSAYVTSGNDNVIDGMVIFSLSTNDKEVYRYVTELDTNGHASLIL